jgi:hypothetical protein
MAQQSRKLEFAGRSPCSSAATSNSCRGLPRGELHHVLQLAQPSLGERVATA